MVGFGRMVRSRGMMGSRVNRVDGVDRGMMDKRSRGMVRESVGNMVGSRMDRVDGVYRVNRSMVHKGGMVGGHMGVCVGSKMGTVIGHGHANKGQNTENLKSFN